MRVLLDTNILISNLRSPAPDTSATGVVLRVALTGGFTLLFVEGVVEELTRKLRERADLAARIPHADAAELVAAMRTVAELITRLAEPYPEIGRDRKDDFLIAHGVVGEADYLVSWDKDLTDLKEIDGLRIVTPSEFLQILRAEGLL